MFYVYEHWRTDKDECFYVGKGKGKRAYNMHNRNNYHKAISAKVLREGYGIEIKIVASGLTEDEAFSIEMERICFWRKNNADLANFSNGGEGKTGPHSKEHREKISKALKGRTIPQHMKDAVIKSNKARKGRGVKPRTEIHMNNLSASLKGRKAPNMKKIICIDDNIVYESATHAARAYNIKSVSCVSQTCNGKKKSAAGKRFKYVGAE